MRAGPDRNAVTVDDRGDVMGVRALHDEGDDRPLALGVADDPQRIDRAEALMRIGAQLVLMRPDSGAADGLDIVERGPEPDRLHDRRRARLEAMRRLVIGDE